MKKFADQHDNLDILLAGICRLQHKRMQQKMKKFGLHRGQPPILFMLSQEDGLPHSTFARNMEVSPATITNMIKRMENAGFVLRRRDTEDERVSRVYLTDAGRNILAEVEVEMQDMEETIFAGFSVEEKILMRRFMQQMLGNLRQALGEEENILI